MTRNDSQSLIGLRRLKIAPFVPADAGTQNLAKELGSRFRGSERSMLQRAPIPY